MSTIDSEYSGLSFWFILLVLTVGEFLGNTKPPFAIFMGLPSTICRAASVYRPICDAALGLEAKNKSSSSCCASGGAPSFSASILYCLASNPANLIGIIYDP